MQFFDFHHHDFNKNEGIYNLAFQAELPMGSFSAGIHPASITENMDAHFDWLKEVSQNKKCVAIGECGLDGLIKVEEKLQEDVFERQISWANEIKKPLIIHCVKRFSKLQQFKKLAKVPMVVHGFNKRKTIGDDLQNQDFYLSFGKSVLYNVNLQDFLRSFPIDKIVLETDSADFKIEMLYEKVAVLKNLELDDLTQKIRENIHNLHISL